MVDTPDQQIPPLPIEPSPEMRLEEFKDNQHFLQEVSGDKWSLLQDMMEDAGEEARRNQSLIDRAYEA